MAKHFVAKRSEIPEGRSQTFIVNGKRVIVLDIDGTLRAYKNFCPHMGAAVRFNGCQLMCEWHGATFDPSSGEPKTGPAVESGPLERIELLEEGDELYCEIAEPASSPWADDF